MSKDPSRIPNFETSALPSGEEPRTRLVFPPNPQAGELFDAPNGVTYGFDGVVWMVAGRWGNPNLLFARLRRKTHRETALRAEIAASRQKAADLEAALQEETAARLATLREAEARAAKKFGAPLASPAPPTPEEEQTVPPTPEEEKDDPTTPEEEEDGPQTELTLLFFKEVYRSRPPKKWGYRRFREPMKPWVADKNKEDGGNRITPSETTIRKVLKKLRSGARNASD